MPTCHRLTLPNSTRLAVEVLHRTAARHTAVEGPSSATRRRYRYPDTPHRGSNPWGRRGRRRCGLCRLWRQKCEYTHLNEPCTLCAEKGRECTRDDKVYGPRHQPSVDDDIPETLPNDAVYIERYNAFWPDHHCSPRIFISSLSPHVGIPLYKPYLEFARSSNLFKSAILVFMSYQETKSEQCETLEYFGAYYQGVRNSIKSNSILELVYSDYIMAVYALVTSQDVSTILVWCTQFCRCLDQLSAVYVTGEELLWIETLWQGVLSSLYYILRDQWHHCRRWGENSKELNKLLALSDWALGDCLFAPVYPMTAQVILQKIKSLSINMQFYLEQFLFEQSEGLYSQDTQRRLHLTLDRIILLMRENPINDTATGLLYYFAVAIKGIFEGHARGIYEAANRLIELSHTGLSILLVKRSLFWAGIILSKLPVSNSILRELRHCGECRWSECEMSGGEVSEIIDASARVPIEKVWNNPALFCFNETLAPWFFGMNLVRFEYTGQGRSLEMIGG